VISQSVYTFRGVGGKAVHGTGRSAEDTKDSEGGGGTQTKKLQTSTDRSKGEKLKTCGSKETPQENRRKKGGGTTFPSFGTRGGAYFLGWGVPRKAEMYRKNLHSRPPVILVI